MKIKLTATNTIWVNCKKWNQLDDRNNHDCGIFAFHYHSRNDFDGAHSFWIFGGSQMAQSLFEYLCTLIFSSWIYDMWENIIDTHLMILGIVDLVKWPDRKVSSYKDIRICLRSNNEDLFCKSGDLLSEKFYILSFIAVVFVLDMFLKSQLTMVITIMSEMDLSIK